MAVGIGSPNLLGQMMQMAKLGVQPWEQRKGFERKTQDIGTTVKKEKTRQTELLESKLTELFNQLMAEASEAEGKHIGLGKHGKVFGQLPIPGAKVIGAGMQGWKARLDAKAQKGALERVLSDPRLKALGRKGTFLEGYADEAIKEFKGDVESLRGDISPGQAFTGAFGKGLLQAKAGEKMFSKMGDLFGPTGKTSSMEFDVFGDSSFTDALTEGFPGKTPFKNLFENIKGGKGKDLFGNLMGEMGEEADKLKLIPMLQLLFGGGGGGLDFEMGDYFGK